VRRAREQGLSLTGPDGLLKQLTKAVLETALDQEMTGHLGHEKNAPVVSGTGNIRNGTRPKTVLTESTGEVGIEVPRDRAGTFEPTRAPGVHTPGARDYDDRTVTGPRSPGLPW
jgi:putative transposase